MKSVFAGNFNFQTTEAVISIHRTSAFRLDSTRRAAGDVQTANRVGVVVAGVSDNWRKSTTESGKRLETIGKIQQTTE